MTTKAEQLAQFNILAAPVLAWLEQGAPHVTTKFFGEIGFNMEDFFNNKSYSYHDDYAKNSCNTIMCMAGAIGQFNYKSDILHPHMKKLAKQYKDNFSDESKSRAKELAKGTAIANTHSVLDRLFPDLAGEFYMLFRPNEYFYKKDSDQRGKPYDEITAKEAAKTLKKFMETGKVSWKHIKLKD